MLKSKFAMSLVVCAMTLVSCSESNSVRMLTGDYSYKTSGTVVVGDSVSMTLLLPNEIGQLSIVSLHNKATNDSVLLTFNPLGGQVYTTMGVVCGNKIEIQPFQRYIQVDLADFLVDISGEATQQDDVVIFRWKYAGKGQLLQVPLVSEDVMTIAKIN